MRNYFGPVIGIVLLMPAVARPEPAIQTMGELTPWMTAREGPFVSPDWRPYPGATRPTLKFPPAVVMDGGRPVLELRTVDESIKIGRPVRIDVARTPRMVWEWKAIVLPEGGDVRQSRRNDQAGRVVLVFEGLRVLLYVWDTSAPVGIEVRPDTLGDIGERALIVVRSGPTELGQWRREVRDMRKDYARLFGGDAPGPVKWLGLESHSDDVHSHSVVRFGVIRFEPLTGSAP
jgi:hypothetical protein